MCGAFLSRTLGWHSKRKVKAMNPNQLNVAKARVVRNELLEEARRSRHQARAERHAARAGRPRTSFHTHPLSALLELGFSGRR
jgi:hypothetical protein